jgi:putative ABC transport system substrate-binding protein
MRLIFVQGMCCGHLAHAECQMTFRIDGSSLLMLVVALVVGAMYPLTQVRANDLKRPVRIGVLTESWGPSLPTVGMRDGLETLGYRENRDYFLGVRFTQGNLAELSTAARELVQHGADLIFADGVNATKAAQGATQKTPIIFARVDDPVTFGLVQGYARPGGNLTGVTDLGMQLGPKRLELFREMIPGLQRVLFPYDATDTISAKELQIYRQAAAHLGIEVVELALRTQAEAQEMLIGSQDKQIQGSLSPYHLYLNIPGFVLQATSEQRMATMFPDAFFVERGGLVSYGPDNYETGRLAARLVDKILKGTKPADIPVEVNNNIVFAINLKTAKALGLTIPPEVLFQADRIIR